MLTSASSGQKPPAEEPTPQGDKDGQPAGDKDASPQQNKGQGKEQSTSSSDGRQKNAFAEGKSISQKIDEATQAQQKAQSEYESLGSQYEKKTVAHDDIKTVSGWSDKPKGYTDVSPEQVKTYSDEIGHTPSKAGAMDQVKNGGFEGKYNSSHAEKQLLTAKPNEPVGVSRPMCKDCQNFASSQAKTTGQSVVISDPNGTHIFTSDGGHQFIPH